MEILLPILKWSASSVLSSIVFKLIFFIYVDRQDGNPMSRCLFCMNQEAFSAIVREFVLKNL